MNASTPAAMPLDETSRRMVELLQEDGRLSVSTLAQQLGISRSNAHQRFHRLLASHAITGIQARVSPDRVGLHISALVFVTLHQERWRSFREKLPSVSELEYFAVTTGQHDAMLLLRAADVTRIHTLVSLELAQWPEIKATETVFLMDEAHFLPELPRDPQRSAPHDDDSGTMAGMMRFIRTRDTV